MLVYSKAKINDFGIKIFFWSSKVNHIHLRRYLGVSHNSDLSLKKKKDRFFLPSFPFLLHTLQKRKTKGGKTNKQKTLCSSSSI